MLFDMVLLFKKLYIKIQSINKRWEERKQKSILLAFVSGRPGERNGF